MKLTKAFCSKATYLWAIALCAGTWGLPSMAQEAEEVADDTEERYGEIEEIVVEGSLRSLPKEDVGSVFGFDKTLLETPRSASTISSEQMNRFDMRDIDELIALAPGTFHPIVFWCRGVSGRTWNLRRNLFPGSASTGQPW